jgi:hypothetical protein
MRQDFFEYMPQFKLNLFANHKPSFHGVDEAIRRRMNLIPFTVMIPEHERDPDLTEKLRAERPGILQWAIEGAVEYHRIGLAPPAAVTQAIEAYLIEEDSFGRWVEECCTVSRTLFGNGAALWANGKSVYINTLRSDSGGGSRIRFHAEMHVSTHGPNCRSGNRHRRPAARVVGDCAVRFEMNAFGKRAAGLPEHSNLDAARRRPRPGKNPVNRWHGAQSSAQGRRRIGPLPV